MKRTLMSILLLFTLILQILAGPNSNLKFNGKGEFKIVQFTDTHINLKNASNLEVFTTIKEVISIEKPDMIILTGDIITEDDPQQAYRNLAQIFEDAHTPWAVVFGNHDSEHNFSRKQLADFLFSLPMCLNNDIRTIQGNSNFILPVIGKDKKPATLLYCMDSNSYSTLKPAVEGYGWFNFSQVEWYRNSSAVYTQANNGKPLPSLAFFHIPLQEYTLGWNNKSSKAFGVRNEDESSQALNTGMFAAMVLGGDVMGTFVGHDHINDYIAVYQNIALAYGRVTKKMKDADDPIAGGRVILMKEGKRQFDTWIRETGGKKVLECAFPDSFILKK